MTDILKVVDILPDEAKHLAQKLHRKKDEIEIYRKAFVGDVEDAGGEERTIVARVSTNDRDRDGEIVEPKGIELKDFQANPVLLWAHDYSTPPVGKALWSKTDEKGLVCKFQFAQTQFAEDIYQLYKGGYLRAFSIGFIPTDFDTKTKTYNKISLLEVSAVPVPANQNALVMEAYAKGIVTSEALRKDFGLDEPAVTSGYAQVGPIPDAGQVITTTTESGDTYTKVVPKEATMVLDEATPESAPEAEPVVDEGDVEEPQVDDVVLELSIPELDHLRLSVENLAIQMNGLLKGIEEMRDIIDGKTIATAIVKTCQEHATPDTLPEPIPESAQTITITASPKSDAQVIAEYVKSKAFREMLSIEVDKAIGRVR